MSPTKSSKLEDHAATAALYVTRNKGDKPDKSSNYPLDADGKLSSAGAATSLKHANPQDLPAFPVVGLQNTESSAGAAASLANKNQKTFEHWKPGEIPAANKAALLAKDYKAEPLWHPELSAAGSKAALLAAKDGGNVNMWRPESTAAGHSAAGQAMRMKGLSPQIHHGHTEEGGKRALVAATGAMSGSRKRSESTPVPPVSYPDAGNSATNALKAANSANRPSGGQPAPAAPTESFINASRIHSQAITNLSREMYTSHPPVAPEVEERNKQAGLRAAAVSMAKQMYDLQQRQIEHSVALRRSDSQYAASTVTDRPRSSESSGETAPPQYASLQEAAKKLAAERLAKLHDEHAAYRTYYGTQMPHHKKLSLRGRRRASSDGLAGDSDEERSKMIRNQMSLFTDTLAQVDRKKRQKDRELLMAAAQRNVRASLCAQDERVFNETGKVTPAMMAEWEAKAKAKVEADSEARLVTHGMVNIGGGKYLDQSEVDAIATAKVQPTLDEITETAERQRARDEELRQQQLERERIAAEKAADDKERAARTKEEWRRFKEEEKREERARKEEARAKKAEEKRLRDEEKRKSREQKALPNTGPAPPAAEVIEETVMAVDEPSKRTTTKAARGDEERNPSALMPTSEMESTKAEEVKLAPVGTEDTTITPMVTAETGEAPVASLRSAEETARRAFAAPVEGETKPSAAAADNVSETEELANATSNIDDAPVVGAERIIVPVTEVTSATALPTTATNEQSSITSKPEAPSVSPIAPTNIPAATTETTVSGHVTPKPPKDKDSGKVSSWLKTKFSRRTSKPSNTSSSTTHPTISEPKDPKVFVGGANLGAPDNSTTSSDMLGSSMREVAMAGKQAGPVDAPVVSPTSLDDDDNPAGAVYEEHTSSSRSVSSLSSDEDTRGRSAVRLADTILPENQPSPAIFGNTAATHDDRPVAVTRDSMVGEPLDPALPHGGERQSSSMGGTTGTEDFEEARDEFDSEKLVPPEKGIIGGEERKSDSPARDSRFIEEL
ncbi:MAG: hypothetical protein Q9217_000299 [Psora testacea]